MPHYTRRKFLYDTAVSTLGFSLTPSLTCVAADSSFGGQFPDMLIASLIRDANALAAKWDVERSRIITPEQTLARGRLVRNSVLEMLGGFPEKNDLNPVTTSVLEREGYRVENVLFESRPNFWVTGNLYVPTSGSGPFPAVIAPAGHYPEANRTPPYQLLNILLAMNGFVVLGFDPIGQGERRHFWNPSTGVDDLGVSTDEHSVFGQRLLLIGENFGQYRIWDGIRAIDYLIARPEVDSARIGCTGHSGGGWATLFITLLDERVKCAVSNEGGPVHTEHWFPLDDRPGAPFRVIDAEQYLFPSASRGTDRCDIYQAIAPRPMLLATEYFAGPRYSRIAQEHIQDCYQRLGAAERFLAIEAGDEHFLTHKLRLATVDWFSRWFYGRPGPAREPELNPEPEQKLYCTPNGSLRDANMGDSIHAIILRSQKHLPPKQGVPKSASELASFRSQMIAKVSKALRYKSAERPPAVRRIGVTPRRGYTIERLEILSEPGIYIPIWVMLPDGRQQPFKPIIYVNDLGRQHRPIGMEFGLLEAMVRHGHMIVAADVRGIGDTAHGRPEMRPFSPVRNLFSIETGMAYLAWLMDKSLLGMRVFDLVRTLDYALSRDDVNGSGVAVIGSGMGATWALYAAALDSRIDSAVSEGGLLSYKAIMSADRFKHDASIFALDVLHLFDLPDVAAAVAPRRLVLMSPVDHLKRRVASSAVRESYEFTRLVYGAAGTQEEFAIRNSGTGTGLAEEYLSALGL